MRVLIVIVSAKHHIHFPLVTVNKCKLHVSLLYSLIVIELIRREPVGYIIRHQLFQFGKLPLYLWSRVRPVPNQDLNL